MYIKNVFGSFFIFDKKKLFTYVAGNWVQQANKNNRSPCSFFTKNDLCQEFWLYLDIFTSGYFSYEKMYTYKKAKTSICHRTNFYSIFNMSSYWKPAIQNDLPKLTKVKFAIFSPKLWPRILTFVNVSILNHYLIAVLKNSEIKK